MADVRNRVIVLANRAQFKHESSGGHVVVTRSASGLVTALEPLPDAYSGTWVAHAVGSADMTMGTTISRLRRESAAGDAAKPDGRVLAHPVARPRVSAFG